MQPANKNMEQDSLRTSQIKNAHKTIKSPPHGKKKPNFSVAVRTGTYLAHNQKIGRELSRDQSFILSQGQKPLSAGISFY